MSNYKCLSVCLSVYISSVLARNLLKGGAGVVFRATAGVPKAARAVRACLHCDHALAH